MRSIRLLLLPATWCCLLAQGPPDGGFVRFHPLLKALDGNGDGVLAAGEIKGAPGVLRRLDTNGDGTVSGAEMRPAFEGRGRGPRVEQPSTGAGELVKTLMAFDANSDGKLAKEEVPERMRNLFARADGDGDGYLTEPELQKAAAQSGGPAREGDRGGREGERGGRPPRFDTVMRALDGDGDGSISKTEIERSGEALKALDKNGDGSITEDEVRPPFRGRGEGGFRREFER